MQEARSANSPKRVRVAESDLGEDDGGDSIEVDCEVLYVTSPERDSADENTRHTTAVSASAPSGGRQPTSRNIPAGYMNKFKSQVMTARDALSALGPAEEVRGAFQEGMQLTQNNGDPGFATEPHGCPAPAGRSTHGGYPTNATSWSPSHSKTISSDRHAPAVEGLDQAASLKPLAGRNMNQTGSPFMESPSSTGQITTMNFTNTTPNPIGNHGQVISPSKPQEGENSLHNSNSISRLVNSSLDNAPETSQAERTYHSLTAQIAAQVSQTLSPPNHQQPFADGVQASPLDQTGDGITSPDDSGISEGSYSPTSSENSDSSNSLDRVANAPQGMEYPQNSSQNGGDSQLPFERRFSQSFNMAQTAAGHPPVPVPRKTDQSRDAESTRPVPPGPPSQNAWPNGPPPPPPAPPRALTQSQVLPSLPISQNLWPNGPPPPPQRPPPASQNAWQNGPPPPPPPPPRALPQSQGPPPPPVSQNLWPNGPSTPSTSTTSPYLSECMAKWPSAAPSAHFQSGFTRSTTTYVTPKCMAKWPSTTSTGIISRPGSTTSPRLSIMAKWPSAAPCAHFQSEPGFARSITYVTPKCMAKWPSATPSYSISQSWSTTSTTSTSSPRIN